MGGKEGGKNKKSTLCKTWFFRGLPIRASMAPLWEARKEEKTKKPHFVKRGFFVVCPYSPLWHLCGRQGRSRDKSHQTSTGLKKAKFLTKKNFTIYLGRGKYPSKAFVFLFFFGPCVGFVHFEVQNLDFFCPCAGLAHFEVQNLDFFCPSASSVHVDFQNPMHRYICIVI